MFVPSDGCVLVDADYSQIELRILAHMAGDEGMREAFLSGGDFHAETAAKVFHVARADVTPEMRRSAKAVNFGIVYGISAFSLSQDIGVTVAEAKAYDSYKFCITQADGRVVWKADPYAFHAATRPGTDSKLAPLSYDWQDDAWQRSLKRKPL